MKRRNFLVMAAIGSNMACFRSLLQADEAGSNPWLANELMEPATLVGLLKASGKPPVVISVAFPFLYRQRHIPNARFAGPGSKPEGIATLKDAVSQIPHDQTIVIYCGCCPMEHCPNIRPAYRTLKTLGFRNIRVLNLPTNFHTDWTVKGYPVQPEGPHLS